MLYLYAVLADFYGTHHKFDLSPIFPPNDVFISSTLSSIDIFGHTSKKLRLTFPTVIQSITYTKNKSRELRLGLHNFSKKIHNALPFLHLPLCPVGPGHGSVMTEEMRRKIDG